MSRIRSKDTRPEMAVRRLVHGMGYRYRLHAKELPGRPDLVFRPRRKVIFVHGCFWHGHDCPLFTLPGTRTDFWKEKIDRNCDRDREVRVSLESGGYQFVTLNSEFSAFRFSCPIPAWPGR